MINLIINYFNHIFFKNFHLFTTNLNLAPEFLFFPTLSIGLSPISFVWHFGNVPTRSYRLAQLLLFFRLLWSRVRAALEINQI